MANIVFLSFYSGEVNRGVETYVHELSNQLVKLGHSITVIQNGPPSPNSLYHAITTNLPVSSFSKTSSAVLVNSLFHQISMIKFTNLAFSKLPADTQILIATNNRSQAIISKIKSTSKLKLIIPGQAGPGIDERLCLLLNPNAFVSLSDYQTAWAKKTNPNTNVVKIPNGVDIHKFHPKVKPISIDLPKPIILCVAAMWPAMKRQNLLIKAASKLKHGSVLLVGEGEGKAEVETLGNQLLPGRFKLLSFPHHLMPSVYTACDLFDFPTSSWESFGIVLLEAMASGLPVVANDDSIRREIVGNAGLFVDPTHETDHLNAITKALSTSWGNKPIEQAAKFSWENIALQYEKLCQSLIS